MLSLIIFASAAESPLSSSELANAAESFRQRGFAVLPGFAGKDEVESMKSSMGGMVAAWWREERASPDAGAVFRTDENQTAAQAQSKYFFDSATKVGYFREDVEVNGMSEETPPPLNKVGHGLHLESATPFGAYSHSAKVGAVARHVAGLQAPVLPQSMYIFKNANVGGSVTVRRPPGFKPAALALLERQTTAAKGCSLLSDAWRPDPAPRSRTKTAPFCTRGRSRQSSGCGSRCTTPTRTTAACGHGRGRTWSRSGANSCVRALRAAVARRL